MDMILGLHSGVLLEVGAQLDHMEVRHINALEVHTVVTTEEQMPVVMGAAMRDVCALLDHQTLALSGARLDISVPRVPVVR